MIRSLSLALSLFCLLALPAQAVVNSGDPGGNRSAPSGDDGEPSDPGWDYVGEVSFSTGVYLGDGWVLTAKHITAGNFKFNGRTYKWDTAPAKPVPGADLHIFRLLEWPDEDDFPPLKIVDMPPSPSQLLVMIGLGKGSEDELTYWKVDQSVQPWSWTQVDNRAEGNAAGILAPKRPVKAWGTNRASAFNKHPKIGEFFITDFSEAPPQATAFEAQAVSNDSGGPVFVQGRDGQWYLCGIMVTVNRLFPGQPMVKPPNIQSAVFGNQTIVIDLSAYRDFIYDNTSIGL